MSGVSVSASFQVPFALDARERLVRPEGVARGAAYRCPECKGAVDLHAGERKRRHFHHRSTTSACTTESVAHHTAKLLVAAAVNAAREEGGGPAPVFVRSCAAGGCPRTTRQPVPAKVTRAVVETALPSGRIVDVALLGRAGLLVAVVEVVRTHAVDAEKALAIGAPWIEVDAAQACESEGRELVAVTDRFLPWLCEEHAGERRARARESRAEPLRRNALLRALPFRLEDYPGYRVVEMTRCARGHDAFVFAWDGKTPPSPRPPLVVAREPESTWSYAPLQGGWRELLPYRRTWVSTCPACGEPVRGRSSP